MIYQKMISHHSFIFYAYIYIYIFIYLSWNQSNLHLLIADLFRLTSELPPLFIGYYCTVIPKTVL